MTTTANWVTILAPVPDVNKFYSHLEGNIDKVVDAPKRDFTKYVSVFRPESRPTFRTKVKKSRDEVSAFVGVESNWTKEKKQIKTISLCLLAGAHLNGLRSCLVNSRQRQALVV